MPPISREWRTTGDAELLIDAAPTDIYARISDVTATAGDGLECRSCEWLPGSQPGAVGARFRGRNRHGLARWSRVCEVTRAEPGEAFEFRTVPERFDPTRMDSTTWGYRLEPRGTGTLVTHYYEITQPPLAPFKALYGVLLPHHRDMRPHLAHTLRGLL